MSNAWIVDLRHYLDPSGAFATLYKYVNEGRFPSPINVGYRSVRWKLADVLAWRERVSKDGEHAHQ